MSSGWRAVHISGQPTTTPLYQYHQVKNLYSHNYIVTLPLYSSRHYINITIISYQCIFGRLVHVVHFSISFYYTNIHTYIHT